MIHENSLTALEEINTDGSKEARKSAIINCYKGDGRWLRDFDVLQALYPGETDMNLVRPRITELVQADILIESPVKGISHSGNRPVRLTRLTTNQLNMELI